MERKKLGLIINPVAGLGGGVGLKGSDGMVEEALARGAVPQSECRARVALQELLHDRDHLIVYTGTGNMGANLARELGFECVVMESGEPMRLRPKIPKCFHTGCRSRGWI